MTLTQKVMRVGKTAAIAVALGLCGHAAGQDSPPPPPGPDVFYRAARPAGGPGGPDDAVAFFVGFEGGLGGKTVTGAPFSASFSTQTKQVLADGNVIQRSDTGTLARDSQGRTRRDMTLTGIALLASSNQTAPHVVMINDPVAGSQYVLEVDQKMARKMPMRQSRKQAVAGNGPSGGWRAQNDSSHVTTASLGTQTINGVLAEGTRTTRTIPAGTIGNTNPIVITVERWYSSDLQTVVMMKRSDPRMGETTFQLTNIQRQEPDASLFQVPADYAVRDGRPGRNVRRLPPPPDGGTAEP